MLCYYCHKKAFARIKWFERDSDAIFDTEIYYVCSLHASTFLKAENNWYAVVWRKGQKYGLSNKNYKIEMAPTPLI